MATGEKTSVKARDGLVAGSGKGMPWVQHGFQFSEGARGRLQDMRAQDIGTSLTERTGSGLLTFGSNRIRGRRVTFANVQTGAFLVGDRNRVAGSIMTDIGSDGVVVFGNRNRILKNDIAVSSVDGVFLSGDDNLVAGAPSRTCRSASGPSRATATAPSRSSSCAFRSRLASGAFRTIDPEFAAPFTLTCASATECDDANECTTDTCDVNGTCGNAAVTDGTPCTGGVCTGGVCQ
jgi:hypothetical protein